MQVASSIKEEGGEAISVPGDVTAEDFAAEIIKATIEKYGALHILVNNAGDLLISILCSCSGCWDIRALVSCIHSFVVLCMPSAHHDRCTARHTSFSWLDTKIAPSHMSASIGKDRLVTFWSGWIHAL